MALQESLELRTTDAFRALDALEGRLDGLTADVDLDIDTSSANAALDRTKDAITETKEQVRLTGSEYRQVIAAMEEGLTSAQAIARVTGTTTQSAEETEAAFRRLQAALELSEEDARALFTSIQRTTKEAAQMDDDLRRIATSMGLSEDEARKFAAQVRNAENATEAATAEANQLSATWGRLRGLIVGAVAAFGVRGLLRGFNEAITSATALGESINAVEVVFGAASDAVVDFGSKAAQNVGLAASEFNQLATPIGAVLNNFEFGAQGAADGAIELTQRAADLASVFNTDVTEALAAINSALIGQSEPLRKYAATITEAQVTQKALALGLGETASSLTEAAKGQARYRLILEQTAFAAGDFANTADQAANRQRILSAEFEDTTAALGEKLLPVFERALDSGPALIEAFSDAAPAIADLATQFVDLGIAALGAVDPIADLFGVLSRTVEADLSGVFDSFVDSVQGSEDPIGRAGEQVAKFLGLFEILPNVGTAASQFEVFKGAVRGITRDISDGIDPIDALNKALITLTEQGIEFTAESLGVLQQAAGLTDAEFSTFVGALLSQREGLNLSAESVEALVDALRELANIGQRGVGLNFDRGGRGRKQVDDANDALANFRNNVDAVFDPGVAQQQLSDRFADLPVVIQNLDDLEVALADAGISLTDFLTQGSDETGIVAVLDETETSALRVKAALSQLRDQPPIDFDLTPAEQSLAEIIASLDETSTKLNDLTLAGTPEIEIDEGTTVASFLSQLEGLQFDQAGFEIDLSKIAIKTPDLAAVLAEAGADVAGALAESFAADPEAAARAQELITGTADSLAQFTAERFGSTLKTATPAELANLAVFAADNFISGAVRSQIGETAEAIGQLLEDNLDGLRIDPAIIIGLSNAVIERSTLPNFSAGGTGSQTGGGGGGGANIEVNINNATSQDVSSSASQAAQIIASSTQYLPN